MSWSVTGWSGGSRQPLTYRLRAGQFRGMGTVRGYSNNIFINNNYQGFSGYNYGYNYGCNCDSGSSTPKWMNWMMGLGLGTSFFGNIMSMFGFGGGGAVEGQGGSKTNTDAQAEADRNCKSIKTLFGKDVEAVVFINGEYNARLKDGTILTAADSSGLIDEINKRKAKPEETDTTDNPTSTTSTPGTGTSATVTPTTTSNVPKLFEGSTQQSLTTTSAVLSKFTELTSANATEITSITDSNGITISAVVDKGNSTQVTANVQLTSSDLTKLKNKETVTKDKIGGLTVKFNELDGYIRMTVGEQTYIVGSIKTDNTTTYNAYQYKDGNVIGYGKPNWTNKTKQGT